MNTAIIERPSFADQSAGIKIEELLYCLYARKSTEAEERQAMSIDSQIREMTRMAENQGLNIICTKKESHSAKISGQREIFNSMLEEIEEGIYNSLVCWDVSRISRSGGDIGRVIDLMDKGLLIEIRTHGQNFTNSPNDKFLLLLLASQSKMENDVKGVNVKRGLRTRCEMGVRPGCVPLGYKLIRSQDFREPSKIIVDEERAPFIKKMFQYINSGLSGRQVNEYLTDEGFRTKSGKTLGFSMTYRILKEPFYYGEFESPKGSGNWYKGSHKALITKEVFEQTQEQIKTIDKGEWGRKNFYFSRLLKCGHCGSGISGEERINRHNKRYIYYKCNKYGGRKVCKSKYISESNLIEALTKIIDQIKSQHENLERRLSHEVEKFNDLQKILNKGKEAQTLFTTDYIEYIFKNGNNQEKSNILHYIQGQLYLENGEVLLKL
ncbi:recombinase family protein [Patescibacteria group bacterium]|nr:recombinase family protein [Patescibacteria group bacterium]